MLTWPREVEERVAKARRISLFVDFDGTLAPIATYPSDAWLEMTTRDILAALTRKDGIVITIISGRSLDDLRMRVNLPDIIYAGNRGLEISGRHLEFIEPVAVTWSKQLLDMTELLASELRSVPGVIVEYKGLTSTVHYRCAAEADIPTIEYAVREAVMQFSALFQVDVGKKALDIVPRSGWHKGCAVSWINEHLGHKDALCIYFGDDNTDEEAFRSLPGAITFKVGRNSESRARYRVDSPTEVCEFLRWLSFTK